jgi:hypothetical protein
MKLLKVFFVFSLFLTSCKTYHITTQSLQTQLDSAYKIKEPVTFARGLKAFLLYSRWKPENPLREVIVLDNKNNSKIIKVTMHTGVRVTMNDGKRKTFYFDTFKLKNDVITGNIDHFMQIPIKPIYVEDVVKIQLQR